MTIFEGYGAVRQGVNDGRRDALAGLMVAGEYNRIYDERNMAAIMKAAPKPKAAPALIYGATPDIPGQPTAGLPTGDACRHRWCAGSVRSTASNERVHHPKNQKPIHTSNERVHHPKNQKPTHTSNEPYYSEG